MGSKDKQFSQGDIPDTETKTKNKHKKRIQIIEEQP